MKWLMLVGVTALFAADAASAQISSVPFNQPAPSGAKVVTFDSPLPSGFSLSGGQIVQGTMQNRYAAPAGDTTKYLESGIGTATVTADKAYNTVGFYWGSIGSTDAVSFLDSAGKVIATQMGFDTPGLPAYGEQTAGSNNRYTTYTVDPAYAGGGIKAISFNGGAFSFEVDDIAFSNATNGSPSPVPEPATMGLFALGGGALLARARRNRARKAVAAA